MRFIAWFILVLIPLAGCTNAAYKIPQREYRQQVKTLGVLPLLVDGRSAIVHPEAEAIVRLLRRVAEGRSPQLVETLRAGKGYFDVRLVQEPPVLLAEKLLGSGLRDSQGLPTGFKLDSQYLKDLCQRAAVDALLVMVLQGVEHEEKRWSRNTFEYLTTRFNDIMATAAVVTADGQRVWALNGADATLIQPLQYPDFDEAYYNHTQKVRLKFISYAGLEKSLVPAATPNDDRIPAQPLTDWLDRVARALTPSFLSSLFAR
ncbi:MAG: hypothetical protein GW875_06445 [Deltaproteobacteria bacterium]|nr:hypothetical protein [Deltaproteobacteria bacterium]NCP03735.1 hypothetical protein [Deltaproteobacteria bacterium]NCP78536.1 hypothetical protein [Desulfuromonadales bacterium]